MLAEGHTIPVDWNGDLGDLGPGIDASITAGFALKEKIDRPARFALSPPRSRPEAETDASQWSSWSRWQLWPGRRGSDL